MSKNITSKYTHWGRNSAALQTGSSSDQQNIAKSAGSKRYPTGPTGFNYPPMNPQLPIDSCWKIRPSFRIDCNAWSTSRKAILRVTGYSTPYHILKLQQDRYHLSRLYVGKLLNVDDYPIIFQLNLENVHVHVHWCFASLVNKLFDVEFTMNGLIIVVGSHHVFSTSVCIFYPRVPSSNMAKESPSSTDDLPFAPPFMGTFHWLILVY